MTHLRAENGVRRGGGINLFLDLIERAGNRLPDQVTIFASLAAVTLVLSFLAASFSWSAVNPITGARVEALNLLSREGVQWVFANVVKNFTGFAPLGVVLVAMIGVGIAEKAGLFTVLLKALVSAVPRWAVTPTVVFAGVMSNVASDAGYVILPPLAAMLYASLGRHPLAGIIAAFAGVAGGFSANLLPSTLDPMLSELTQLAARNLDKAYSVNALCNYYFLFASTFLLTLVGWFISDRIVEPRLGPWKPTADTPALAGFEPLTAVEKRGMWAAAVAAGLALLGMVWLVAPSDGILRDMKETGVKHFKPFFDSLVPLIMLLFLVPGLVYGIVTRQIRSDKDATKMMTGTISTMGHYIVMAFFASQFIEWFKHSQLGFIIAVEGAALLKAVHLTGTPLMIGFVIVVAIFNLLISSASAKWTVLAPVFVPMFMLLHISPEATQAYYRVGDSVTNIITPLNYYFPVLLAAAHRYEPTAGVGTLIAGALPFSVAFLLAWTVLLVIWMALGWPIGPAAPLTYGT